MNPNLQNSFVNALTLDVEGIYGALPRRISQCAIALSILFRKPQNPASFACEGWVSPRNVIDVIK